MAALKAADPALVAKADRAIDRARNVRSDVKAGKAAATPRQAGVGVSASCCSRAARVR
ncbi:hypothetical protein GCM10010195_49440 [Kitasatospora griseola]|nr:hypothetical protein GCM10010195_49440 [Kitasatospora griseola]